MVGSYCKTANRIIKNCSSYMNKCEFSTLISADQQYSTIVDIITILECKVVHSSEQCSHKSTLVSHLLLPV